MRRWSACSLGSKRIVRLLRAKRSHSSPCTLTATPIMRSRLVFISLWIVPSSGFVLRNSQTTFQSSIIAESATFLPSIRLTTSPRLPTAIQAVPAQDIGGNNYNDENGNNNKFPTISFNLFYGGLWSTFLTYGIVFSPGQLLDPTDTTLVQNLLEDPTNAAQTINPLFFAVFNSLGLIPLVMTQLVCPQSSTSSQSSSKGMSWSATPFLLGSFAAGYGALGLYLTFRAPPVDQKTLAESSWFTRNVLENKLFAWAVVVVSTSLLVTSGIGSSVLHNDLGQVLDGYTDLAASSKLVAVSSVDLVILTVSAATLIPKDYKLRRRSTENDIVDSQEATASDSQTQIRLVAASTILLPLVGAALYCALRPPLPEE